MIVYSDTRQQEGKHRNIEEFCRRKGIELRTVTLKTGDYTADPIDYKITVDTKQGLKEVYCNLIGHREHERFKRECIRAQDAGIRLIVLVEERGIGSLKEVKNWANPRIIQYDELRLAHLHGKLLHKPLPKAPPVSSERLMNIMRTMSERYGVEWQFCDPKDTGKRIVEILYGVTL